MPQTEQVRAAGFGRICLFGDHCDWAGRQVIASSINRKIMTKAMRRNDDMVRIRISNSFHGRVNEAEFAINDASNMPLRGNSLKYVNAIVCAFHEKGFQIHGTELEIKSDVPMKKGLSSSAALCISTSKAFNELYSFGLSLDDLVKVSYRAENELLEIACGMMDQTAAAYKGPLFMDFNSGFHYSPMRSKHPLPLVIIGLDGERDTERILNTLNHFYFRERDPLIVKTLGTDIPKLVLRAKEEMENDCRLERIGQLMDQNQRYYDRGLKPFCPQELDDRRLYEALDKARGLGALGAKWTGAGGAGSIIALTQDSKASEEMVSSLKPNFSSISITVG